MGARLGLLWSAFCAIPLGCALGVSVSGGDAHPHDGGSSDGSLVLDLDAVASPGDAGSNDSGKSDGAPDAAPPPPLPCDSKFTVPSVVYANTTFAVGFTDSVGWVYIGLSVSGPGSPVAQLTNITGSFTWHFDVWGQAAGKLHMVFTKDNGTNVASCDLAVQ